MKWEDVLREGAHQLVFGRHPARLENIILMQMRFMQNQKVIPSWENYRATTHYLITRKYFTKEEFFLYRCRFIRLFKATWPAPQP